MKYNYHTHTYRCHHADGTDEEYVKAALRAGFEKMGFADHCPWPGIKVSTVRMPPDALSDYVSSVKALKAKYAGQLELHLGLEAEYFPQYLPWLIEQKQQYGIEYLIFGHHYWPPRELSANYQARDMNIRRFTLYAETAVDAMASGQYLYFAHPDLPFIAADRDDIPKLRPLCREICQAAAAYHIPLEFNILGLFRSELPVTEQNFYSPALFSQWLSGKYLCYPYPVFWEEAVLAKCKAVIGVDAHDPGLILDSRLYNCAESFLQELGIPVIDPLP